MNLSNSQRRYIDEVTQQKELRQVQDAIAQNCPDLPKVEDDGLPILPETIDPTLTAQHRAAIAHLISGRSYSSTASLMGIGRRTLFGWRRKPAFARAVDELTKEALHVVAMRTRNLLLRSTYRLERSLDSASCFEKAMRIVNSKRVWEMANVMPNLSEEADAEDPSSTEPSPQAGEGAGAA